MRGSRSSTAARGRGPSGGCPHRRTCRTPDPSPWSSRNAPPSVIGRRSISLALGNYQGPLRICGPVSALGGRSPGGKDVSGNVLAGRSPSRSHVIGFHGHGRAVRLANDGDRSAGSVHHRLGRGGPDGDPRDREPALNPARQRGPELLARDRGLPRPAGRARLQPGSDGPDAPAGRTRLSPIVARGGSGGPLSGTSRTGSAPAGRRIGLAA